MARADDARRLPRRERRPLAVSQRRRPEPSAEAAAAADTQNPVGDRVRPLVPRLPVQPTGPSAGEGLAVLRLRRCRPRRKARDHPKGSGPRDEDGLRHHGNGPAADLPRSVWLPGEPRAFRRRSGPGLQPRGEQRARPRRDGWRGSRRQGSMLRFPPGPGSLEARAGRSAGSDSAPGSRGRAARSGGSPERRRRAR